MAATPKLDLVFFVQQHPQGTGEVQPHLVCSLSPLFPSQTNQSTDQPTHHPGGLLLHASSLHLLRHHRRGLQRCAALFGLVQRHLAAAQKALASAARDWRSAMSDMGRRMEQLASDLSDAGAGAPDGVGDLTLLLCTGAITQVGGGHGIALFSQHLFPLDTS
jgi:hypothetical protein